MHSFRRKILLFLLGLVVVTQAVTLFAVLARTSGSVQARAVAQLEAAGGSVRQLIRFRDSQLANGVSVLAADFGFREAVASGDSPTILSAIQNQGRRIGASFIAVFDIDGRVVATTSSALNASASVLPRLLADEARAPGRAHALQLGEQAIQLFAAPVRAPEVIGWVAMGFAVDDQLAREIRAITGGEVTLAHASGAESLPLASTLPAGANRGEFLSHRLPLTAGQSAVTVTLHEPLERVMRPYYDVRNAMLAIGGAALVAAGLLALWLGRLALRPVDRLVAAAGRIEAGDYGHPLAAEREQEFARLAGAFNAMQLGISEREQRLASAAFRDGLTALPNAAGAELELNRLLQGTGGSAAVLAIEVRGLSDIGATFGQDIADRALREVVHRLGDCIAPGDVLARISTDRLLVMRSDGSEPRAVDAARQLASALGSGLRLDAVDSPLDARIGISLAPAHADSATDLVRRAEVALGDARSTGRACSIYEAGSDERFRRRVELSADLRRALLQDEMSLVFQPKVRMSDGTVSGAEALVRWQHPKLGAIPPSEFIPLAEASGSIRDLTRWVLQAALRQAAGWRTLPGMHLDLAINVSAADLLDPQLGDEVIALLARHAVPATSVVLEITESALVHDVGAAARCMALLQAAGIRFAIDDFGTGHSSLSLLQRLPVDLLKIDRSFVLHAHEKEEDREIVASTVNLAHALGIRVVAEGVEHQASWDVLDALRCDYVQGYFVSRPLIAEDLIRFVASRSRVPDGAAGDDRRTARG